MLGSLGSGTFPGLNNASNYMSTENKQGLKLGDPDEVAWRIGFLSDDELRERAAWLLRADTAAIFSSTVGSHQCRFQDSRRDPQPAVHNDNGDLLQIVSDTEQYQRTEHTFMGISVNKGRDHQAEPAARPAMPIHSVIGFTGRNVLNPGRWQAPSWHYCGLGCR